MISIMNLSDEELLKMGEESFKIYQQDTLQKMGKTLNEINNE